ncbi:alpha-L-fucosidase [Lentisphaera profundi]|uniref:alpha-L-fucosidase n=1 Tax=Lentisphaera profundi TaxID=1658616 RepID=A0ABY7VNI3_9BACT|nr:alpha-L-fucosidase [Lentisphaera profundi]WDE95212.1 alpha-L-fucosidase [Lentisphaera profundi]
MNNIPHSETELTAELPIRKNSHYPNASNTSYCTSMIHKKYILILLILMTSFFTGCQSEKVYTSNWDSLAKHDPAPEWLEDAKLGIYFHWGPYSVPAYMTEWYPRLMWFDSEKIGPFYGDNVFKHHEKTYGHPSKYPYHKFIPQFTGKHFDPSEWAELFELAGAKFAGPVAEHHDGFSMWNSELTPWNAKDRGPKRDVLGELFSSLKKRNLKTIATFHHAKNFQRHNSESYETERKKYAFTDKSRRISFNSHFPYLEGHATSSDDPELQKLYGNMPHDQWHEDMWLGKLEEVIDNYDPDIVWFDSWLDQIPASYRQRFSAYYLNEAAKRNKNVAIIRKQNDLPLDYTINDHEKSREPKALPELWMTDDTLSTDSWSYTKDMKIKPVDMVLHSLIDTVSKNGVLLLNISPTSQGVIPDDQRNVLLKMGQWLKESGKAIYSTRPWITAAEGPSTAPPPGLNNKDFFLNLKYSYKDIRYTMSKDKKTVYAISLGAPPQNKKLILTSPVSNNLKIKSITDIEGTPLDWRLINNSISISPKKLNNLATVYVINLI